MWCVCLIFPWCLQPASSTPCLDQETPFLFLSCLLLNLWYLHELIAALYHLLYKCLSPFICGCGTTTKSTVLPSFCSAHPLLSWEPKAVHYSFRCKCRLSRDLNHANKASVRISHTDTLISSCRNACYYSLGVCGWTARLRSMADDHCWKQLCRRSVVLPFALLAFLPLSQLLLWNMGAPEVKLWFLLEKAEGTNFRPRDYKPDRCDFK